MSQLIREIDQKSKQRTELDGWTRAVANQSQEMEKEESARSLPFSDATVEQMGTVRHFVLSMICHK